MTVSIITDDCNAFHKLTDSNQMITQLVFYLHFVVGILMVISPAIFAELVNNRPSLLDFAVVTNAEHQMQMLYLYERAAASFQVFVGLAGILSGVDNWYMSLALMVFDGFTAYELKQYK